MFTNITILALRRGLPATAAGISELLQPFQYVECAPSQEKSNGFVPPRGEAEGGLVESVAGQYIARFMLERKAVPADVVKRRVAKRCAEIEEETGRKPGKKEKRDLAEEVKHALLPYAFPKRTAAWIWIDPHEGRLVIDSTSQGVVDDVATLLIRAIDGLAIGQVGTQASPEGSMGGWLLESEAPDEFSVDRACDLRAVDESKALVRYENHALDTNEVRDHVREGMVPVSLAMTWDGRVSFVLTDAMQLKKLDFLDTPVGVEKKDAFDADVALATGELRDLIPALLDALGGEVVLAEEGGAA